MKKLFSIMIVFVLVLSLGVSAFATENTGSITITNATIDETYNLFKIFDASYSEDASGNTEAVSYTITEDNQFFEYMFGADGTKVNTYFTYDADTGLVTRNEGTQNSDIIAYLTDMVRSKTDNFTAVDSAIAASKTVIFDELAYGYYLIDKDLTGMSEEQKADVAVTIDSNTPDVNVIDKNQKPATEFSKLVWDEDNNEWVVNSSAEIGEIVDFKVQFDATNYDGEHQIKYYSIKDTKGDALWVEFDKISVEVGGVPLTQGYYHGVAGSHATEEWEYLGTWTDAKDPQNAQWYLIHHGFDEFDIVIPWLSNHTFTGTTNGFDLSFGEDAQSVYNSPVDVVIKYKASVEPGANIGGQYPGNLWNSADLTWTSTVTDGPDDPSISSVNVYALGLKKLDADTEEFLAGAEFEIYRDEACTDAVYVIPTNIKGVYILDDLNTIVSGEYRETSREKYAAYLDAYLQGAVQKNVVTSQENGKLVVLGLEAGDYYLKETKAPDGYNTLPQVTQVTVGQSNQTFFVIADANGNVIDSQTAIEGYTMHTYFATNTVVENSKGVELPSTGGHGTMMLITIGTLVAMAFAILLITHKKMSVYHD